MFTGRQRSKNKRKKDIRMKSNAKMVHKNYKFNRDKSKK